MKCLPKILFNIDIMDLFLLNIDIIDLCLLLSFCILFIRRLESATKVFMSKVVLTNVKFSEPIDA